MWIITWLLQVLLAEANLSSNQYSKVKGGDGQQVCSVNDPSAAIYGVRRPVNCLLEHCVPTKSCLSANYYADTGKCELFHYIPTDFFRIADGCVHYRVINNIIMETELIRRSNFVMTLTGQLKETLVHKEPLLILNQFNRILLSRICRRQLMQWK